MENIFKVNNNILITIFNIILQKNYMVRRPHAFGIDRTLIVGACMESSAYTLNADIHNNSWDNDVFRSNLAACSEIKTHAYLCTPSSRIKKFTDRT